MVRRTIKPDWNVLVSEGHLDISKNDNEKVIGRILTFTDGVFAIAILALLIDIRLPEGTTTANLGPSLSALWPNYLAFFISFVVIALYWSAHVRLFRQIIRYDWVLVWLNIVSLLIIVVIPFATTVLSTHFTRLSVLIYAVTIACAGYMNTIVRAYATRGRRLISDIYSNSYITRGILLSVIAPLGFTIAIGLSFVSTLAAELCWITISVVHIAAQRLLRIREQ